MAKGSSVGTVGRKAIFALVFVAILLAPYTPGAPTSSCAFAAEPEKPTVVIAHVEGEIFDSIVAMLGRAASTAEREKASRLVLEIDSPGGSIEAMDEIGRILDRVQVEPVAYVRGDALSAAAYVALCGKSIYLGANSQIGSATPIFVIPGIGLVPTDKIDRSINEKLLSVVRSKFRARASKHERPGIDALAAAMVDSDIEVVLAEIPRSDGRGSELQPMTRTDFDDLVRKGERVAINKTINPKGKLLNLSAQEAFDYGLSDGSVESRDEMLRAIGLDGARVIEIRTSWAERLFGFIGKFAWILWGAAIVLLIIEAKTPGFGLPGALGIGLVALLLFRNNMLGLAALPEILLIVLGVVLLAIEIMVIPGFGFTGILGILCIGVGVVLSFLPFVSPSNAYESELLGNALRNFFLSLLLAPIAAYFLFHFGLRHLPFYRNMRLVGGDAAALAGSAASLLPVGERIDLHVGDRGTAVSVLRPSGKVEIDGKWLDATSSGEYIECGVPVEIVSIAANHVVVRQRRDVEFVATAPSNDDRPTT